MTASRTARQAAYGVPIRMALIALRYPRRIGSVVAIVEALRLTVGPTAKSASAGEVTAIWEPATKVVAAPVLRKVRLTMGYCIKSSMFR